MKLAHYQLDTHLANTLAPVYLISGDEIILKQDALSAIRKKANTEGFLERVRFIPEAGYDWGNFYSLLYANSLFNEKRIIEFDFRSTLPPKAASDILKEYALRPDSSNLLILDLSKADEKVLRSTWYKALDNIGVTLSIWPLSNDQLRQWIIKRVSRYKLTIQSDAAAMLAELVEGNLVAASQAIEKLYLMKPTSAIDATLVNSVLSDESRFTIFDFIDTLISGHRIRTLHILENLKLDGMEPAIMLWGITRELRLLLNYASQLSKGVPFQQICQTNRIFAKRQPVIKAFLAKQLSEQDYLALLSTCFDIDKQIKGIATGDPWQSLSLLSLRLTQ